MTIIVERKVGPVILKLGNGVELFYAHWQIEEEVINLIGAVPGMRLIDVTVALSKPEEWCRYPNGTERRCNHVKELKKSMRGNEFDPEPWETLPWEFVFDGILAVAFLVVLYLAIWH